jgi:tetratricopeptide (TPR) repeat protein
MIACPKCNRQIQPKRTCIYCGHVLAEGPRNVQGLDANAWVAEGTRFAGQNQLDRALQCFDKALLVDKKSAAAWSGKARIHSTRGERDEAVKCLNEALAIDPNDGQNKALRGRLAQLPQGLPPGRPATMSVSSAAGMQQREYAARAGAALYGVLQFVPSAAEILATNWMCAVPPHTGWPGAPREVLTHVFTKDAHAFGFYWTADSPSVPSGRITDEELAAWGALLQSGRARAVSLAANVVWSPPLRARVHAVNERLARLGSAAKIELIVVS